MTSDVDVLKFIRSRLINKYEESPNTDFILRLGEVIDKMPTRSGREGDSQDLPTVNEEEDIQSRVINDIAERRKIGIERYGTPLQPFNNRNALLDAYEETIDQAMYLKQMTVELEKRLNWVKEAIVGITLADHKGDAIDEMFAICDALDIEKPEFNERRNRYVFSWEEDELDG